MDHPEKPSKRLKLDHRDNSSKRLSHEDYTVGWICPLEVEQVAAVEMLDEEHEQLPQPANDHNVYTLGSFNGHNVVIAGLPSTGNSSAATVVTQMRNTFVKLRFGLLVGIGGGVPVCTDNGPIRLGHVVVSKPAGEHSGAVQYDHGKAETGQFRRTGFLAPPPTVLLNAAQRLAVGRARSRQDPLLAHLSRIDTTIRGLRRYKYPGADKDHLYRAEYVHLTPNISCQKCGCDPSQRVDRSSDDSDDDNEADEQEIVVHRGTVAAGELVVKDGLLRDKLAEQYGILCFEMEAAGALADFPCLVIRGISDYSDSHKNVKWHGYAAAIAAAYARQLFFHMPVDEVEKCRIAESDVHHLIVKTNILARGNRDEKVRQWLSPADPSSNYNEALAKRHAGSGRWLLTSSLYEKWRNEPKSLLWLHGIPGCGKTILSASVLEDLMGSEKPSDIVLYFYFDFKDKAKQTLDGMLRSLVAQLYQLSEASQNHFCDAYSAHNNGSRQPSTRTLGEILREMTKEVKNVMIILDALDECETRKELLPWLRSILEWREDLHMLMTSRKEADITSSLTKWVLPANIICLETSAINGDIREYVQTRVKESEDFGRWTSRPDIQTLIETELMAKASGMFRWAACQLDVLGQCVTLPNLRSSLNGLPKTLDETYDRILASIPEINREISIRALQLITYSERPLNIKELADAIVVEVGCQPPFDPQNRLPDPMDITRLCSSMISTVPSTWWKHDPLRFEVQLAHFSVKEYLTSSRVGEEFKHHFAEPNARAAIVHVSLAYLSCVEERGHDTKHRFPFFEPSMKWMDHALVAESSEEYPVEFVSEFLRKGLYNRLLALLDRESSSSFTRSDDDDIESSWRLRIHPLFWPCSNGLIGTVRKLIDDGAEIDCYKEGDDDDPFFDPWECDCIGHDPMFGAWEGGHKDIIRLLLENGAHINAEVGSLGYSLIFDALRYQDEDFALELLERGADPNRTGLLFEDDCYDLFPQECSVLFQAASQGCTRVVEALLDKGVDINLQCDTEGTALSVAAERGHTAIVQLLLNKGAEVNSQREYTPNALISASQNGHEKIVRLLLEAGANVDATFEDDIGESKGNALTFASGNGHDAIIEMLLKSGAQINANPLEDGSALAKAALGHHSNTVRLLLENGANPNIRDSRGTCALDCFFQSRPPACEESIPLLLIQNGADLGERNQKDNFLLLSCQKNYRRVVEMLLDEGSNIESTARVSSTSSSYNAVSDEIELQRGDLDEGDGKHHGNALHVASSRGFVEIITLLLNRGANKSLLDWHGWTPALIASKYGHIHASQILAESGNIEGHCKDLCLSPSQFTNNMSTGFNQKAVWADHPFPENSQLSYFEVEVPNAARKCRFPWDMFEVEVGVLCVDYPDPTKGPGHSKGCRWTIRNDGFFVAENSSYIALELQFQVGDVIGCGVDYEENMIFYCKNKKFLGRTFRIPVGRLFPAVILPDRVVDVKVNFNATPPARAPSKRKWRDKRLSKRLASGLF